MIDDALKSALNWWEVSGVDMPPASKTKKPTLKTKQSTQNGSQTEASLANTNTSTAPSNPKSLANPKNLAIQEDEAARLAQAETLSKSAKSLEDLKSLISQFDAGRLSDGARQSVFAKGNPQSDLMIIGEAPSREDDVSGVPFTGAQGNLLEKMMAAIGLDASQYYVTNFLFWHPTQNWTLTDTDMAINKAFTLAHIELCTPQNILLMGNLALEGLTGKSGIMKERGQWTEIKTASQTFGALPVFHPSLLLRQPALKRDMWRDLLALRDKLVTQKPQD